MTYSIISYFCNETDCHQGFLTPPQCKSTKCSILVTDYPCKFIIAYLCILIHDFFSAISSAFNTSLVSELITTNNLFVKIAFVGPNLDQVVSFLDDNTRQEGNSFVVLHYAPSILTIRHNLTALLFPDCHDPLILRPEIKPECLYTANRLAKVAWKPVQSRAQELFNFLENFSFEYEEYMELLNSYNIMMETSPS